MKYNPECCSTFKNILNRVNYNLSEVQRSSGLSGKQATFIRPHSDRKHCAEKFYGEQPRSQKLKPTEWCRDGEPICSCCAIELLDVPDNHWTTKRQQAPSWWVLFGSIWTEYYCAGFLEQKERSAVIADIRHQREAVPVFALEKSVWFMFNYLLWPSKETLEKRRFPNPWTKAYMSVDCRQDQQYFGFLQLGCMFESRVRNVLIV